jgi:hypothetical protein
LRIARWILLGVVFFLPRALLHADGGTLRFSERKGPYRIGVFTSPTPLRAGLMDVSVFVQDVASGEPVAAARITVCAAPRDSRGETICQRATTAAATNKLFQAAVFEVHKSGWWDVAIRIEGLDEPLQAHFEMEVGEPLPRLEELAPWIVWPGGAIVLFFVHQWLVRRKSR